MDGPLVIFSCHSPQRFQSTEWPVMSCCVVNKLFTPLSHCMGVHVSYYVVWWLVAGSGCDRCYVQPEGIRTRSSNDYSTEGHSGRVSSIAGNVIIFTGLWVQKNILTYSFPISSTNIFLSSWCIDVWSQYSSIIPKQSAIQMAQHCYTVWTHYVVKQFNCWVCVLCIHTYYCQLA